MTQEITLYVYLQHKYQTGYEYAIYASDEDVEIVEIQSIGKLSLPRESISMLVLNSSLEIAEKLILLGYNVHLETNLYDVLTVDGKIVEGDETGEQLEYNLLEYPAMSKLIHLYTEYPGQLYITKNSTKEVNKAYKKMNADDLGDFIDISIIQVFDKVMANKLTNITTNLEIEKLMK